MKDLLFSSQNSQVRPNSFGQWWLSRAKALAYHLKLTVKVSTTGVWHFNHELLPILLSLYFPISIASCNSQGSILRNIANSSITEVRINIKLGEDLLLSLDGAPIAALDDLNCVAAIFFATYKLMYRANKPSEVLQFPVLNPVGPPCTFLPPLAVKY